MVIPILRADVRLSAQKKKTTLTLRLIITA